MSLRDLVPDQLTGRASNKSEITLEQLLTMRSGIDFDNDVFSMEMYIDRPADPLHYMLAKPLYAAPGERFYYRDVDPQILGYLLQQETGESASRKRAGPGATSSSRSAFTITCGKKDRTARPWLRTACTCAHAIWQSSAS